MVASHELDVRKLLLLREFAIHGTIAAVAEHRNYTPSAVSQQLAQLERDVGTPLLRRSGRRLQLTAQGDVLAASAGAILDILEAARGALEATQTEVQGSVRVAVFQSAALALLPATLRVMAEQHPDVRVEVVQHEPEAALRATWARDFDMVVAEQYPGHAAPHHSGLDRRGLTSDAIRLALPAGDHALVPVEDLATAATMPWVMEPAGAASRHFAEQMCRTHGFEPDVRYETEDLQAQIRLVEAGVAVALLPDLVWADRSTSCRLVELPGHPRRTVFTAQREAGNGSPAIRAFRSVLEHTALEARHPAR
ncbi:LysR family transcriptional regulator [Curtobacterium ammoniigenes]|uniref:LysR family transcriptional regulator n=1 Tax=Curtobacterium ammoniigenes TaxID=395387 RepID=UPI0008372E39|nr:LysR family transcriptional regulator [Curtobacterium ammoniigenes]